MRMRNAQEELNNYKNFTLQDIKVFSDKIDIAFKKQFEIFETRIHKLNVELAESQDQL